jgi:hypothetical protein
MREQIGKYSDIRFQKLPSVLEIDGVALHIRRIVAIPESEGCPELATKFEMEYPLSALSSSIAEVRELCVANKWTRE